MSDSSQNPADQTIIQCPSCETKFAVKNQLLAGIEAPKFHCSRCDHVFQIEQAAHFSSERDQSVSIPAPAEESFEPAGEEQNQTEQNWADSESSEQAAADFGDAFETMSGEAAEQVASAQEEPSQAEEAPQEPQYDPEPPLGSFEDEFSTEAQMQSEEPDPSSWDEHFAASDELQDDEAIEESDSESAVSAWEEASQIAAEQTPRKTFPQVMAASEEVRSVEPEVITETPLGEDPEVWEEVSEEEAREAIQTEFEFGPDELSALLTSSAGAASAEAQASELETGAENTLETQQEIPEQAQHESPQSEEQWQAEESWQAEDRQDEAPEEIAEASSEAEWHAESSAVEAPQESSTVSNETEERSEATEPAEEAWQADAATPESSDPEPVEAQAAEEEFLAEDKQFETSEQDEEPALEASPEDEALASEVSEDKSESEEQTVSATANWQDELAGLTAGASEAEDLVALAESDDETLEKTTGESLDADSSEDEAPIWSESVTPAEEPVATENEEAPAEEFLTSEAREEDLLEVATEEALAEERSEVEEAPEEELRAEQHGEAEQESDAQVETEEKWEASSEAQAEENTNTDEDWTASNEEQAEEEADELSTSSAEQEEDKADSEEETQADETEDPAEDNFTDAPADGFVESFPSFASGVATIASEEDARAASESLSQPKDSLGDDEEPAVETFDEELEAKEAEETDPELEVDTTIVSPEVAAAANKARRPNPLFLFSAPMFGLFLLLLGGGFVDGAPWVIARTVASSFFPDMREVAPAGLELRGKTVEAHRFSNGDLAYIIRATLENNSAHVLKDIDLEGVLFDADGVVLKQKRARAANNFSKGKLSSLTSAMVTEMQSDTGAKRIALKPGERSEVAVAVFPDPALQPRLFSLRIYSVVRVL